MSDENSHPTFYSFGTHDRPKCPQCGKCMHLTGRAPSSMLGGAYECKEFTCTRGFQIEQGQSEQREASTRGVRLLIANPE